MTKALTIKQVWDEAQRELAELGGVFARDLDPIVRIGFVSGVMKALEALATGRRIDPRDAEAFLLAAHSDALRQVKAVRAIRAARERTPSPSTN